MKTAAVLITLILLIFSVSSIDAQPAAKIKVIATIHPLADIIRNIGSDRVEVITLLPAGASPHIFEPTPGIMSEIQQAKGFFKIGADLELWADKIIKAAGKKDLRVVDLSEGMPLIYASHSHDAEHKHSKNRKHPDPHYWLDPVLCSMMVDKIAATLSQIDPASKTQYAKNAAAYKKELDMLHRDISEKTAGFTNRGYVTFHSAWAYFSHRYNLDILGVIEEAPGREPSPKNVSNIITRLKKSRAKVVFAEPQFNPKIAEAIAAEAGAKVVLLDPIGSPQNSDTSTYLKLMRYNTAQMQRAMK
ncbi:MAG: metal ABC transporter substrate-binding protein [Nitrospiraceae bacterium]|nr:metal ABC transporter substrate-binding protein [Nitrospiraceae bacterium]